MTQEQLAEKIGVSAKVVSKWETGRSLPDTSFLLPLCDALGLDEPLGELTGQIFARHTEVFAGMKWTVRPAAEAGGFPELVVKRGRHELRVPAFSSVAYLDGKPFDLGSVAVYMDKNNTFYLPGSLAAKLDGKK